MNDRFKFRYFNKEANKMVEATNWQNIDGIYECLKQQICFDENIPPLPYDHIGNGLVFMQCTGLKDKNGKLIYEDDIVIINENYIDWSAIDDFYRKQNFVVEYSEHQARYILKANKFKNNSGDGVYDLSPDFYEFLNWGSTGENLPYGTLNFIETIGNIWENKDLLEE